MSRRSSRSSAKNDESDESIYETDSEDEPNNFDTSEKRDINYLLHWRPNSRWWKRPAKNKKIKPIPPITNPSQQNNQPPGPIYAKPADTDFLPMFDKGFYRIWFLPPIIDLRITSVTNSRGFVSREPEVMNSELVCGVTSLVFEGDSQNMRNSLNQTSAIPKSNESQAQIESVSKISINATDTHPNERISDTKWRHANERGNPEDDYMSPRSDNLLLRSNFLAMNHYLYTLQLRHGEFTWTIRRRWKHFYQLRDRIRLQKAMLKLHIPGKDSRQDRQIMELEKRQETGSSATDGINVSRRHLLPPFPRGGDHWIQPEEVEPRRKCLEEYLQRAVNIRRIRNNPELGRLLEVSPVSFIRSLGQKMKEGFVWKRTGTRRGGGCCSLLCCHCFTAWHRRWLFLKETCIGYLRPGSWDVADVILFDHKFKVRCGRAATGYKYGMEIVSSGRRLLCKCSSERQMHEWFVAMHNAKISSGRMFTSPNRFQSFAPTREHTHIKWFVDSVLYFDSMADALENAKEQIFITDWWLSPEIHLKRPIRDNRYRLDMILKRKAEAGVQIYILLYKEIEVTLSINSAYSKQALQRLHPNIRVMRHPDHLAGGVLLWAHHEKMVVIDQRICYIGGIDLCFGRWDTQSHVITDFDCFRLNPLLQTPKNAIFEVPVLTAASFANSRSFPSMIEPVSVVKPSPVDSARNGSSVLRMSTITESLEMTPQSFDVSSQGKRSLSFSAVDERENTSQSPLTEMSHSDKHPPSFLSSLSFTSASGRYKLREGSVAHVWEQLAQNAPRFSLRDDGQLVIKVKVDHHRTQKAIDHFKRRLSRVDSRGTSSENSRHKSSGFAVPCENGSFPTDSSVPPPLSDGSGHQIDSPRGVEGTHRRMSFLRSLGRSKSVDANDSEVQQQPSVERIVIPSMSRLATVTEAVRKLKSPLTKETIGEDEMNTGDELSSSLNGTFSCQGNIWDGKDYVNWRIKDCIEAQFPSRDLVDRKQIPRMPWHDIASVVYGRCARDFARHFIQRWNATKIEKAKSIDRIPFLLPKSYDHSGVLRSETQYCQTACVQALRSSCRWSAGISHVEDSILRAYEQCIQDAQHYIYIENQFFITSCVDGDPVLNRIGKAILQRILWAAKNQTTFRVFIVLPLLPAFEGEVTKDSGAPIQAILHYIRRSISHGSCSLFEHLRCNGYDPERYISVCSVRTYAKMGDHIKTEMVYVHSKLLIVDDRVVIIGSANINDRSLLGNRDSELALICEDTKLTDGTLAGQPAKIGAFASSLRVSIMREHLGVPGKYRCTPQKMANLPAKDRQLMNELTGKLHAAESGPDGESNSLEWDYELLADPADENFYNNVWQNTAKNNTEFYEEIFNCLPTDKVKNFNELNAWRHKTCMAETALSEAEERLKKIRGNLVRFPMDFLRDENLEPKPCTKEGILPYEVWC